MHKYKIEALTHRKRPSGGAISVWANYIVEAANPIEAREKFWLKYPGKSPACIHELDGKTRKSLKRWSSDELTNFKEKILVEYDINS